MHLVPRKSNVSLTTVVAEQVGDALGITFNSRTKDRLLGLVVIKAEDDGQLASQIVVNDIIMTYSGTNVK